MTKKTDSNKNPEEHVETTASDVANNSDVATVAMEIVALDLGSNSFHMVVSRVIQDEISVLGKLSEKVMLAAGLDEKNYLSDEAQERGLACLQRFAQRVSKLTTDNVRIVATNALRTARNSAAFIAKAEAILGHPVEVISGREEARLIYLGVAHTIADDMGRRLVVDIGGGSTEFIVGERFESMALESLHMGCVSYNKRYFADGKISRQAFEQAVIAARREIWSIEARYRELGWINVVGASGTIRSIERVLVAEGLSAEGITRTGLEQLKERVLAFTSPEQLPFSSLKSARRNVFVAGLAILYGIFEQLDVEVMTYSDGALREGVLYDQVGRIRHEDVRDRTTRALAMRYYSDEIQAERVARTAEAIFNEVAIEWDIQQLNYLELLYRAARLHEIGLAISHSQFHKHGAYLVTHSDLSGFSKREQEALASLIRCHRRKLALSVFEQLPAPWDSVCLKLTLILRIAVILHHSRSEALLPFLSMGATEKGYLLEFEKGWLEEHPLTRSDLEQEKKYLAVAGWEMEFA